MNRVLPLVFVLFSLALQAQQTGTGQWRVHLPFRRTLGVEETPQYIYTWAEKGFYRFNKAEKEVQRLSKIEGFSNFVVNTIKYNAATKTLVVAYEDGTFDLVNDNGIINIADIARSSVNGVKKINEVFFDGNIAYIICSFGVVIFDMDRLETKDNYSDLGFGDINTATIWNGKIYIGTENGIYSGDMSGSVDLRAPGEWQQEKTGNTTFLRTFGNRVYAVNNNTIKNFDGTQWTDAGDTGSFKSAFVNSNNIVFTRKDTLVYIDQSQSLSRKYVQNATTAIIGGDGVIWYSTDLFGALGQDAQGNLIYTMPNGPFSYNAAQAVNLNDEMYVTGGGVSDNYTFAYSIDGYYKYSGDKWYSSREENNPAANDKYAFYAAAVDKKHGNVWLAAYFQAILLIREGKVQAVFDSTNSSLSLNTINFVSGMVVDDDGNLWVSNFGTKYPLSVRTAQGEWDSIPLNGAMNISQIVIDDKGRKWMVVPRATSYGLIVYDDNKTPLNQNDDIGPKFLSTVQGSGGLPANEVICIAKDHDGEIWVGTQKGLTVFSSPGNIFSSTPSDSKQIVIEQDGSVGYLLGTEVINCITVDGGNRKWIGTRNGAWLVAADGQKIISHYTEANSPLLSNNVKNIGINGATGEVFFITDNGIISYKGDATDAADKHSNVLVYPNPVREDYEGDISIRGLAQDAYVKITDISGSLIYETQANGGMAIWNGKNFNGRKASTGVYLIFSGTKDGQDTFVTKVLVVR